MKDTIILPDGETVKLEKPTVLAQSGGLRVVIYKEAPYINVIQQRVLFFWWVPVLTFINPNTKEMTIKDMTNQIFRNMMKA